MPRVDLRRRAAGALLACYRASLRGATEEEHDRAWDHYEYLFEKLDDIEKGFLYRLQDRVEALIARPK